MNNPEQTGIVYLEDLPKEEIYIKLEEDSFKYVIERIKEEGNITKFLIKNGIKTSNFWDWYTNKSLIRLDNLLKIKGYLDLKKLNISAFRGKQGKFIKKIKFDFKNPAGVELIANILGDGCVHEKGIRYINSDTKLINNFIENTKKVFGEIDFILGKDEKGVYIVYLPKICMKIVRQLGIEPGSKILNNVRIPQFIYALPNELITNFISRFIDDEGYFIESKLTIDLAFDSYSQPWLMYDLKELFLKLGIKASVYKVRGLYKSKRGNDRQEWRLGIFSYKNLSKLRLSLLIDIKKNRFESILASPRRKHTNIKEYFDLLKNTNKDKRYFTIYDLSDIFDKDLKYSRKIVSGLYKKGLLESFREFSKEKGNLTYIKYIIS